MRKKKQQTEERGKSEGPDGNGGGMSPCTGIKVLGSEMGRENAKAEESVGCGVVWE